MSEREETPEGMPNHLGGGEMRCHDDEGTLDYMIKKYKVKSMLDVGCGRGCQVRMAMNKRLNPAWGVDGDKWLSGKYWRDLPIIIHDYTKGPSQVANTFDLIWSVEFLEHVEEEFIPNFMEDFKKGKYIVCTHALPGKPGYHHVNCQEKEYWIDKFKEFGFKYSEEDTNNIRKATTMRKYFIKNNGLVFINEHNNIS